MSIAARTLGALSIERSQENAVESGRAKLEDSWRRSIEQYRLDPGRPVVTRVLTANECRHLREREESFLRIAQPGATRLHEQVRDSGYCVLLTDAQGAAIDFRGQGQLEQEFRGRGFRLGACWSEEEEGTCGVGTAIVERSPILVHKQEHFLALNDRITCSAAPIFGPDDELLGVLNASALSAPDDRRSQSLVYNLVTQNTALIENAVFSEACRNNWLVRLCPAGDDWGVDEGLYLALDGEGRIVRTGRGLRRRLSRLSQPLDAISDLLDADAESLLRHAHEHPGVPMQVRCHANGGFFQLHLRAPTPTPVRAMIGRSPVRDETGFGPLVSADPRVAASIDRIKRLADSRVPILLQGETGAGKEAFARAIHAYSKRRDKAFVALNCAAIPESLIESELFGYREGAFTGARSKGSPGKVQLASGGTLFLDEIGDMPLALQTRLLRVLAEGEVMALGASTPDWVDLHVVCATHRNLETMVAQGLFREDLLYRLNAATFRLPPLRERSDIQVLIQRILHEEARQSGRNVVLSGEVEQRLLAYHWPGNVRELRNVLRFAVAVCEGSVLQTVHLPENLQPGLAAASSPAASAPAASSARRETADKADILNALERTGWHISEAARQLGMSRSTFYRRMWRYGIGSGVHEGASKADA
ncbi:sigma-54-dependent Fis family transcriptional regulator [Zoogloea sp.]|uniref:sigma-54-dependent Fis family transcriptional regulator n=1 Tax=Zoogloea sp. TaxID=49181 RepID=UPI002B508108|nr:sigma-54-dependent Fis family transcriptional regulator [Zoogloea sp.]HOY01312.1 sigma-54-dependent Fis family transcriptional regulator [Zoogloea sp.]HPI61012.1 sigma-54-dependent Fis family transcriptional regulator [Zoogloea sp.]